MFCKITKMFVLELFVRLIAMSSIVMRVRGEEKFCEKDRKLLLGGIFNYDKIIFAYSWKEVNSVQLWLVWRFEAKTNELVQIGSDTTVDQVFPGIPLFRAGFGLTLKCESTDTKCNAYKELVFIFFQTSYKVFRYKSDKFSAETDVTKIPWALKPRGEASDWFFGTNNMDNVNAIVFMGGYQSQLYIVSKNALYSSPVDVNAGALKWTKLTESKDLGNTLGGFMSGADLFFNKNESPDSVLLKYDQNGKESERITVWKHFGCQDKEEVKTKAKAEGKGEGEREGDATHQQPHELAGADKQKFDLNIKTESPEENDKNIVLIVIVCVVIAVVLTNIITAAFWLNVYRKHKNSFDA